MKKTYFILLSFIVSLMLLVTSGTYAYLMANAKDSSASGIGGCFDINYTSTIGKYNSDTEKLEVSDDYLTPYESDKDYATVKVSKDSKCKIYDKINIKLHSNEETSLELLKEGALKYRIVNSNDENEVWTGAIKNPTDTSLVDFVIAPNVVLTDIEATYKIYLWVDEKVTHKSTYDYNGLKFSGYIYADAIQSSTITK